MNLNLQGKLKQMKQSLEICDKYAAELFDSSANKSASYKLQSNLGYPAMPGPAPIRINDLAEYASYAETQQSRWALYTLFMYLLIANDICNKLTTSMGYIKWMWNEIKQTSNFCFEHDFRWKIDNVHRKIAAG